MISNHPDLFTPAQTAYAKRITDTAVSLHALARTLDIRAGLDVTAPPTPVRAAEWAKVMRDAESLLLSYQALFAHNAARSKRSANVDRGVEAGA